MKKKTIAAAALSLALAPCICLFACTDNNTNNPPAGNSAVSKMENQVSKAKNTYDNIYGRAERNGGLFSSSSSKSAMKANYALAEDGNDDAQPSDDEIDTNALIEQLLTAIKSNGSYSLPNQYAVQSYVLDVFAYTQIASHLMTAEGKKALTQNYSIDYDLDDEFSAKMKTDGGWYPNIPEEMSFAGFDEASTKVNLVFKARNPFDRRNNVNKIETVNSEMYYISDDDFGYAQFTYRTNYSGAPETGFNYFSMKDKAMLEINMNPATGKITYLDTYDGTKLSDLSASQQTAVETCLAALETIFTLRTFTLEQQNLALAVEAGIEDIQTTEKDGETLYIKSNADTPYKVTFDYNILAKLK